VIYARGNIDHEPIGGDPLRDRLAANKGLMRGGDVEHPGVDEIRNPQLPKNRPAS
jgi:hypothetical protein